MFVGRECSWTCNGILYEMNTMMMTYMQIKNFCTFPDRVLMQMQKLTRSVGALDNKCSFMALQLSEIKKLLSSGKDNLHG